MVRRECLSTGNWDYDNMTSNSLSSFNAIYRQCTNDDQCDSPIMKVNSHIWGYDWYIYLQLIVYSRLSALFGYSLSIIALIIAIGIFICFRFVNVQIMILICFQKITLPSKFNSYQLSNIVYVARNILYCRNSRYSNAKSMWR
jgi:hypothetical protein